MKGRETFLGRHSSYCRWATESGPGSKLPVPVFYNTGESHVDSAQAPQVGSLGKEAWNPTPPSSIVGEAPDRGPPFSINLHPPLLHLSPHPFGLLLTL